MERQDFTPGEPGTIARGKLVVLAQHRFAQRDEMPRAIVVPMVMVMAVAMMLMIMAVRVIVVMSMIVAVLM